MRSEILGRIYLLAPLLGGAGVHGLCMKYEPTGFGPLPRASSRSPASR